MKNKPLILALCGVLTVCLIIAGVFYFDYAFRVGYKSTGKHEIANRLRDEIDVLPYLKDGNIYYYKNGEKTLVAENVYVHGSENSVYTADYAIDAKTKKMLYTSEQALYLFDGTENIKIAENVTSWRTREGLEAVAFTTKMQNRDDIGFLFLYRSGETVLLDTGVNPTTVRFSQSGNCIFAEKPNTYPKIRSMLFRYELDGTKTKKQDSSYSVFWTNDDGTSVITGENNDDSLYSYRIFARDFEKEYNFSDVYYAEVTQDQSILYVLHNYKYDMKKGILSAVDLYTLKVKEIAKEVSFFNPSAVTDASKGVVYSRLTDANKNYYSIFYGDIFGKSTRLIKNTTEESLYTVAVNSERKSGYILTYGATYNSGGVYFVKWKGNKLDTQQLDAGYVDSLVYYEETDSVTYIKNPASGHGELYLLKNTGEKALLTSKCGATYDNGSQQYTSASVLSNDNKSVMYFTDIETGKTTVDTKGTLMLLEKTVSENVSSAYMEAPITNGNMTEIYYLQETEAGMDMYKYNGTESVLIESNVDGMIELK